jgi:hypothetical protein
MLVYSHANVKYVYVLQMNKRYHLHQFDSHLLNLYHNSVQPQESLQRFSEVLPINWPRKGIMQSLLTKPLASPLLWVNNSSGVN